MVLILTFIVTVVIKHRWRKPGASKKFVEDAASGVLATFVVGALMFFSHLFVFTPEHIYNAQRTTIRSLETNILVLEDGKHQSLKKTNP